MPRQLAEHYNSTVLCVDGSQQVEICDAGICIISGGMLTSWVVLYRHTGTWVHDGVFTPHRKIAEFLTRLAKLNIKE